MVCDPVIVPFVFTLAPYNEAPYLWYFYKWLEVCKEKHWPIIAQEIYFCPPKYFTSLGRRESYDKDRASVEEYSLPKNDDLNKIGQFKIPDELLEALINEKRSIMDAYCFLLKDVYPPLASQIRDIILNIRKNYSEQIEAFAVLQHLPSLSAVAEEFGIPVVHLERGPFREKNYIKTAFWDLENLQGGHTTEKRYAAFYDICKKGHLPIFTGKELLSIFLEQNQLPVLRRAEKKATKKIGIALGYALDPVCLYRTFFNDAEMLIQARKKYGAENMLARKHPGDPYRAQYPMFSSCMESPNQTTIDFILNCEAVASIISNVSMEAMYYGRKAYTFLPCPSYYAAAHSLQEDPRCASDEYLSFYALCYLIPHEYMTNYQYYLWRLSNPSEEEIYFRHLEFYFQKKNIPFSVLSLTGSERLEAMLKAQGA